MNDTDLKQLFQAIVNTQDTQMRLNRHFLAHIDSLKKQITELQEKLFLIENGHLT